jgi:[acyl-carrier-protein] S-malonyltransferase
VDGVPVRRYEVEDVLARMRRGPAAGLLPRDGGAEGRQLRRWLVQLLTVERLVEQTVAGQPDAGVDRTCRTVQPADLDEPVGDEPVGDEPVGDEAVGDEPVGDEAIELDQTAELELGSVLTAVLLSSSAARIVYRRVTAGLVPTGEQVADYHRRNRDALAEPGTRLARLVPADAAGNTVHDGRMEQSLGWVRPDQLAGELGRAVTETVAGQPSGPVTVAGGRWLVAVDGVRAARAPELAEARERIVTELAGAARRHAFVSWVERARRDRVVLHEGYEHPADPRQPDNTHRH